MCNQLTHDTKDTGNARFMQRYLPAIHGSASFEPHQYFNSLRLVRAASWVESGRPSESIRRPQGLP